MKKLPEPPKSPKARHARRKKNAESDALFLSIGEGAIVTDDRGYVSRINEVALNILGFKAEDILHKWYPSTVIAEDENGRIIPNMERPITEIFLTGKPVFKRLFYRKKDGSSVPVALTVSPVSLDGRPVGAIQVFRDITEELELENSKDEFISIASHQLRTPATIVKQYLGMLMDGYVGKLTKNQLSVLGTAFEYNEHQLDTINDLLHVAQVDANKIMLVRKETDLVDLVKDVVETHQKEYATKNIKLSFKTDVDSLVCKIDPLHIRMTLENLLNNAYKYSSADTKVAVKLKTTPKGVHLSVKDQGMGIESKDIPKLFQKFSRVGNPLSGVGGTGLGLYWAKKLVLLQEGDIKVSSEPGKGTEFIIELPLRESHE